MKNNFIGLFEKCDEKTLFSNVIDVLKDADRVVVNLECAITEDDTPIEKIGPNLKAPLNTVRVLKSSLFTLGSLV